MFIYKISQTVVTGYDTYSDAVVAAENEELARKTHPSKWGVVWHGDWCEDTADVKVELLGTAEPSIKAGVIVASFHAG